VICGYQFRIKKEGWEAGRTGTGYGSPGRRDQSFSVLTLTFVFVMVGSRQGPTTQIIQSMTMVMFCLLLMEQGLSNQQEGYLLNHPDDGQ
jgi:hypothetical protein